jgi:hypothetical protein
MPQLRELRNCKSLVSTLLCPTGLPLTKSIPRAAALYHALGRLLGYSGRASVPSVGFKLLIWY